MPKAKNSVIISQKSIGEPGEPGKSPIDYRLIVDSNTYNTTTNQPSIINYHVLKIEADKPAAKITTSESNLSVWVKIGSSFIQGDMSTFFSPRDVDVREIQLRQGTSVLQSVLINRIKNGDEGADAVRYWLVPSVTSIKKSSTGVITPTSVTCVQLKQVGSNPSAPSTDMTIKYQLSTGLLMNYTGAVQVGSAEYLDFSLHNSAGTIVDKVRVPVVKDGENGGPGEPGKDANLLPWVEQWDSNKTLIDGEYVVSPKMFSGTKSTDGKLTGIAQGRDCISIDGVKRTGIFALVDNEVVFELDPLSKKYVFKGDVYADKGVFKGGIRSNANVIPFSNADVNADGFVDRTIYLNPEDSSDYNVIATYNSSYPSAVCYMYLNGPYADFMGCELNISVTMLAGGSFHDSQFQVKLGVIPSVGRPPLYTNEIYWKGRSIDIIKFKHNTFLKLKAVPKYSYDGIYGTPYENVTTWHVVNVEAFKYVYTTNYLDSLEAIGASDPI